MHILIIPSWYPETPDDVNGIFFRLQAQALQRAGNQVGVIAPIFRSLRNQKSALFCRSKYGIKSYVEENIPTYAYQSMQFFPRVPYLDRDRIIKAGLKMFQRYVAEHGKPDVLHAHCINNGGLIAYEIHKLTGIPYVITEHSTTYARNMIASWQWPRMTEAVKHCAACIAVSKDFAALLEEKFPGSNWQYVPNILSVKFENSEPPVRPNQTDFTFCSVAHLQFKKGYDILLPAFAAAIKQYPHLKLLIGGGGYEEHKLHQLARDLNLQNNVTFLGRLKNNDVLDLMHQSNAFVLASRHETFGVVFIEALSQGLPVIATRCGGPESIVTPENGLLVSVENQTELTDALIRLYENHKNYHPQTLRENCLQEFGEQSVVGQLMSAYEKVTT